MLINEIKPECWDVFILIIIIACGMFLCDIANREAVWDLKYQNWIFNDNPQEGTSWIDSIVRPEKSP